MNMTGPEPLTCVYRPRCPRGPLRPPAWRPWMVSSWCRWERGPRPARCAGVARDLAVHHVPTQRCVVRRRGGRVRRARVRVMVREYRARRMTMRRRHDERRRRRCLARGPRGWVEGLVGVEGVPRARVDSLAFLAVEALGHRLVALHVAQLDGFAGSWTWPRGEGPGGVGGVARVRRAALRHGL